MKELCFSIFLILSPLLISAQDIGFRIGIQRAQMNFLPKSGGENGGKVLGYHVGAFYLLHWKVITIQPELNLHYTGGKMTDSELIAARSKQFFMSYLDIPLIISYEVQNILRLYSGPSLRFLMSAELHNKETILDVKGQFNNASTYWMLGLGVNVWKFMLDIRYEIPSYSLHRGAMQSQEQITFSLGYLLGQ